MLGGGNMGNEKLIQDFTPMINCIIKKYSNFIEFEDLYQECCIAIIEAYDKYDATKGAKLESYMYNVIDWKCKNLVRSNKKHIDTISLQLLASQDNENVTLEDTLEDPVDIADTVEDKLMMLFYKNEIRCELNKDEAEAMLDKYFNGCVGVDRNLIWKAKRNLIRKSYVFREEYRKLKHLPSEVTIN